MSTLLEVTAVPTSAPDWNAVSCHVEAGVAEVALLLATKSGKNATELPDLPDGERCVAARASAGIDEAAAGAMP